MDNWINTEDGMPKSGITVLVVRGECGQRCVTVAEHYADRMLPLHSESEMYEGCIYDEEDDEYYVPPGWYEPMHEDEGAVCSYLDEITHWQNLPKLPSQEKLNG